MNPVVARTAEPPGNNNAMAVPVKADSGPNAKCILQLVPLAVPQPKCLSGPVVTVRYIAVTAIAETAAIKKSPFTHEGFALKHYQQLFADNFNGKKTSRKSFIKRFPAFIFEKDF
jgi:hypothetical protein